MTRARDLADLLNGGKTIASATISGDLTVANKIQHDGDTDSFIQFDGADSLNISTGGGEKILINNTGMTVNEDSADLDFRVESNGNANMLFVDGGNDRVGIGTNSPGHLLHLKNSNPTIRLEDSDGASNIYGLLQADGAGSVYIKADDAGNSGSTKIAFDVDGSEKLRIQTGGGISFNGDTAAANALDDYEEGTYTPAFTSTGASFSYSVQLGSYVKIGQLVCCWFNITLSASPSGTTSNQLTFNVPFATNNVNNSLYSGGHIGHYFNINLGSGTTIAYQLPSASSTQIELKEVGDNIGENGIVASELNTSAVIRGSVMYRAAS
jgi:hypothetical protein